jgi:LytS/YehU family sensor histidine kinase
MKLSLAIALFLVSAAPTSADAAPQAKKPQANRAVQMVTVSGECTKLVHAGKPVEGCKNILVNMNYSTGVSAYWFVTDRTILSFAGDGSRHIEQGADIVVQSVNRIILAATDGSDEDATEDDAVGFCRFGDPTQKGAIIECLAHAQAGLYEGSFVTDGMPPKFGEFPVSSR